jgi:hypothetical protein
LTGVDSLPASPKNAPNPTIAARLAQPNINSFVMRYSFLEKAHE